jgi:adenine-specific DNA methylase
MTVKRRRKLIEVALPLEAINRESAREKSIRHGHPSTLHLWWARRPLAACRAVLFAQLVDDPSARPDPWHARVRQYSATVTAARSPISTLSTPWLPLESDFHGSALSEGREAPSE